MREHVDVEPELFNWAATRCGHDLEAFAEDFPHVRAWASGTEHPTLPQLEAFSRATRTAIGYFFLSKPPAEGLSLPDFRTHASRRTEQASAELRETIYACELRQEWYRDHARLVGILPPRLPHLGPSTPVVQAAAKIRAAISFDLASQQKTATWEKALRLFTDRLDDAGVLVMCNGVVLNNTKRKLDADEFRGFAIADPIAPLIFVNGSDAKAAQMFTLAHEVAHLVAGASALTDSAPDTFDVASAHREMETWCNAVAAEFLVPLSALRARLSPGATLDTELPRLATLFKVSKLVMLRRLHDVGLIDRDRFRHEYAATTAAKKAASGGDFYRTQDTRNGRRFAHALVVSTLEGQTLRRDAFRLLGLTKASTFESYAKHLGVLE